MRLAGYENFKFTKKLFFLSGVLPIIDYYYEPFSREKTKTYKNEKREIKPIDYNIEEQLELIKNFHFQDELLKLPREQINKDIYFYNNDNFTAGDADYYYSLIRYLKPKRIIEVGSGFSTLLALEAIKINQIENNAYNCQLTCIEPYEFKWLKNKNVNFIESLVENVELDVFKTLESNDILFVDSSHIIKPKGDLLYIFMDILPVLKSGVFIHFHDIFSPWDYPQHWIREKLLFWNEQYLLEAFLSHNKDYKVVCSLNFLKNNYWDNIKNYLPVLNEYPNKEPGSFWIIKN
ncbi:MAG: class I SAM-dependent methyltransferase [Candidatus Kapabacteria bacterium]|nr:class I SAM-dependent methyltransferase [Candidatus Kapabacteria bacterium]